MRLSVELDGQFERLGFGPPEPASAFTTDVGHKNVPALTEHRSDRGQMIGRDSGQSSLWRGAGLLTC